MNKPRIAFIWQGVSTHKVGWEDGLAKAMQILEKKYSVSYCEPDDALDNYDALIYWEAPCTISGLNSDKYNQVRSKGIPKILLFAGGPVNTEWCKGFDIICIESQINKDEFAKQGRDTITAFGINDKLFRPIKVDKKYKAIHHGTCASWKRQWLIAETFGKDGILVGRTQETDSYPFTHSKELGANVIDEKKGDDLVKLICQSDVLLQSSDYWGGGQRATLEAMACGVPVICMEDSPKNREYVEESGAGLIAKPEPDDILRVYHDIMSDYDTFSKKGIEYVKKNWTAKHYATQLELAINKII